MAGDKIFISYKRGIDEDFAYELANALQSQDCNIWIDIHNIPPGSNWDREIEINLNSAKYLLIILSPESVNSDNVRNELDFALEKKKKIIPILLRKCEIPIRIQRLQRIDFTKDRDNAFDQLIKSLGGKKTLSQSEKADVIVQKEKMGLSTIYIGILSCLLPIVLVVGQLLYSDCGQILKTLSLYYHTNMKAYYIALHSIIGAMLISYKGYTKKESITVNLSGFFCFLIAFFPATSYPLPPCVFTKDISAVSYTSGLIHYFSLSIFLVLGSLSPLFIFNKNQGLNTLQKAVDNKLYSICGFVIIICLCLLMLSSMLPNGITERYNPIIWLETLAFEAYGITWLVKGNFLFKPPAVRKVF